LAAAGLAIAVAVVVFFLFFERHRTSVPGQATPEALARHVDIGHRALADGKFRLAFREFQAAQDLSERVSALSGLERRRLAQWQRQAKLLADLLPFSLQEIVRHAADLEADQKAWQVDFAERYQGRGVIFDAELRQEGAGKYQVNYVVAVDGQPTRLDLTNLLLLHLLPLEQSQRVLFGARLSDIRREGGVWIIRFDPGSAVLLTDVEGAAACLPKASDLEELVRRQSGWLRLNEE
jgi:hypothetical protein